PGRAKSVSTSCRRSISTSALPPVILAIASLRKFLAPNSWPQIPGSNFLAPISWNCLTTFRARSRSRIAGNDKPFHERLFYWREAWTQTEARQEEAWERSADVSMAGNPSGVRVPLNVGPNGFAAAYSNPYVSPRVQ